MGQLDGRAVGYGGEGWIRDRRVTRGSQAARVPGEYCQWAGMGEYPPFGIVSCLVVRRWLVFVCCIAGGTHV